MYFHNLVIISPWKRAGPSIWKKLNPFHPKMLVPSLVEIVPMVLEKKRTMWKVYDNNNGQRTNFDHKSSLEPWLRWANKQKKRKQHANTNREPVFIFKQYDTFELRIRSEFYCSKDLIVGHISLLHYRETLQSMYYHVFFR